MQAGDRIRDRPQVAPRRFRLHHHCQNNPVAIQIDRDIERAGQRRQGQRDRVDLQFEKSLGEAANLAPGSASLQVGRRQFADGAGESLRLPSGVEPEYARPEQFVHEMHAMRVPAQIEQAENAFVARMRQALAGQRFQRAGQPGFPGRVAGRIVAHHADAAQEKRAPRDSSRVKRLQPLEMAFARFDDRRIAQGPQGRFVDAHTASFLPPRNKLCRFVRPEERPGRPAPPVSCRFTNRETKAC
ncbi:MAG: hypothetical protein BWZ10_03455 [candidate division BRC1 bacterium ADurb.BinA364]|nr:MAG: hypothetical protein BWZ10_03455 [candidate division BRC1 bacterium ADurb.BinA364]